MVTTTTPDARYYVRQADIGIAQTPPGSGIEYPVLAETTMVKLIGIGVYSEWTVQPNLQIHITQNGITETFTLANPVTATFYYPLRQPQQLAGDQLLTIDQDASLRSTFPIEDKLISVSMETTGGTVQSITTRMTYSRYI